MSTAESHDRLSWSTILAYGAPGVGVGYMYLLINLYVLKFSTDVLLISPAFMGAVFAISRVSDAITDPMAGYLSDATKHQMGRRRIWLLGSIVPVGLLFIMVFSPPASLSGGLLAAWMAVSVIGFYAVMTAFVVPHMSLGAELSGDHHERSRLFGQRHAWFTAGSILALGAMQIFIMAEREGEAAVRATSFQLALVAAGVTAALIGFAVWRLKERKEFQGRGAERPFQAFKDVWQNAHARLLIVVTFIEQIGSAAIGILTLFIAQYVVGRYDLAPLMILTYMVPSSLSVPLWLPLSRRFGKKNLWLFSMLLTGIAFGIGFALPFIESETGRLWNIFTLAFFAGLAAGCGGTISPSVQSDVIDYDEWKTGERKEGAYFSAWNFVYKSASGIMGWLTGMVLAISGFIPNEEQTMEVKIAMVTLYSAFPLACYLVGAALFTRFSLNEAEHDKIRADLEERRAAAAAPG